MPMPSPRRDGPVEQLRGAVDWRGLLVAGISSETSHFASRFPLPASGERRHEQAMPPSNVHSRRGQETASLLRAAKGGMGARRLRHGRHHVVCPANIK